MRTSGSATRETKHTFLCCIAFSLLCNNSVVYFFCDGLILMLFCRGLDVVGKYCKMPYSACLLSRKAAIKTVRNFTSANFACQEFYSYNRISADFRIRLGLFKQASSCFSTKSQVMTLFYLSASLRNRCWKCLGSRPNQSITGGYKVWW